MREITPKRLDELRTMARRFAATSIVSEATARLVEQVLLEIHETQIAPRDKRIARLEGVVSCLLDSYLSTDSFDGNKDALALEAERLVPDWQKRAEEWSV